MPDFRGLRSAILALALGLSATLPAVAQQDFPREHLAAARAAIIASRAADGFDNILPTVADQTKSLFIRSNPALTRTIEEVVNGIAVEMVARRPDLDRDIQRIWAARFTKEELDQITAFYSSPVGKKLAGTTQEMIQLSVQAALAWQNRLGTDMVTRVREEMKKRGHAL